MAFLCWKTNKRMALKALSFSGKSSQNVQWTQQSRWKQFILNPITLISKCIGNINQWGTLFTTVALISEARTFAALILWFYFSLLSTLQQNLMHTRSYLVREVASELKRFFGALSTTREMLPNPVILERGQICPQLASLIWRRIQMYWLHWFWLHHGIFGDIP